MQDMNQAIAVLDATKHWRIQCENSTTKGRHYSCTVWNDGRRVTAYARTPLMAAESALKKLKEPKRRTPKAKPATLKVFG